MCTYVYSYMCVHLHTCMYVYVCINTKGKSPVGT